MNNMKKIKQLILTFLVLFFACGMITSAIAQTGSEEEQKSRVWGYIFGDMFWKADGDTALWGRGEFMDTEKNELGGRLRRIYLGYDHDITPDVTTRVLLETNAGTTDPEGRFSPIIKLGYLKWKIPGDFLFNQVLNVGLIPTPIFSFPEKTFGYRSVEKEALDARGIGRSTDQGISYSASFDENSDFGFTVLVGNGTGTRPVDEKRLEYTGSLFGKFFDSRFTIETMFNYKSLGDDRENSILRAFLGYQADTFRFGGEIARIINSVDTPAGFNEVEPLLFSLFAAFNVPQIGDNLEFFGRFDRFDPDTDFRADKIFPDDLQFFSNQSLLIVGFNYQPIDRISVIPNLYFNFYDTKTSGVANRKSDVILRTTLYYTF